MAEPITTQRIDKWLWHVRIIKSRTQAATLAAGGHIRVNRSKVAKASHSVKIGDMITLFWGGRIRILEVAGFVDRRVSAADAVGLYVDHSPKPEPKATSSMPVPPRREPGSGRPTKRDRRQIDRMQRGDP